MSGYTQAQLDNLNSMIARGVLEAEYDGRKVKYATPRQLKEARDEVARCLGAIPRGRRFTLSSPSKGLGN